MATWKKTYKTDAKGKRVVAGTLTTYKATGGSKWRYIPKTERKKPTMQDFFKAVARDSGMLKKKVQKFADVVRKTGGGLTSTGDVVIKLDQGNKNIQEAKGIASDAKRLPSVDAPNTRNTGALKYTPKQKDYKITSASANKKRTSGGRVLTKPAPVRMSNVVELENFVQKNMAAATSKNRGTSLMKEYQRSPEFVPIKVDTSTAKKDFSNPNKAYGELDTKKVAEWWKQRDKKIPTNTYTYDRNLNQKTNKAKLPKWMKTIKYNWSNNLNIFGNPK
jgi:hypothetical protein